MSVDIGAEFFLDLGSKVSDIHRARHWDRPVYDKMVGQATGAAPLIVESQGYVPPGRIYNLLAVSLFGADGHTVLANAVADTYIAASGVELPDFSCQVSGGIAVPSFASFSKDIIWIQPGERPVIIVYGFAAAATVTLVCRIASFPFASKAALEIMR